MIQSSYNNSDYILISICVCATYGTNGTICTMALTDQEIMQILINGI